MKHYKAVVPVTQAKLFNLAKDLLDAAIAYECGVDFTIRFSTVDCVCYQTSIASYDTELRDNTIGLLDCLTFVHEEDEAEDEDED